NFQRKFESKKSNDFWKFAEVYSLKNRINQTGQFEIIVNVIANKCCPECSKNDEKELTEYEAINQSPIGSNECTRKVGCVCGYGIRLKRNDDGRLIPKAD